MIVANEADAKPLLVSINFEVMPFKIMTRVKVNPRNITLKGIKPLLAERFGVDFSHMRTKFTVKNQKK